MNANIGNRSSCRELWVGQPLSPVALYRIGKLGSGKHRPPDCSRCDLFTKPACTFFKAKDMRHAQWELCCLSRLNHLATFCGAHGHGFFTEYGLAMSNCRQRVSQMQGIG